MVRALWIAGALSLALAGVAGLAWVPRTDPIGPVAGRALSGPEVAYPGDWAFSDAHKTIAVEMRPDDPYSVTTIGFMHQGTLHIPAADAAGKEWPRLVAADDRVRIKVGNAVYPARLVRVDNFEPRLVVASIGRKYAQHAGLAAPEGVWLYRVEPRVNVE